ncbi:MAG: N-acetylmuramoyl-L-alanine amidase, partial [Pseudolabrys sp.]
MPWLLRVEGLLIAATFICAALHQARAEPRDVCARATFRAVIDVGHTAESPGATSARGVPEFSFNLDLARRIERQLLATGFKRSVLLLTE